MSHSLSQVYGHLIFSTKHREGLIDDWIEKDLFAYLSQICAAMDSPVVEVGGYRDHVHILCRLSQKVPIDKLVQELKQQSSKWVKQWGEQYSDFHWQEGYGIFSVRHQDVKPVLGYIRNQYEIHQRIDFEREYLGFLKKYEVEYDERYLWD